MMWSLIIECCLTQLHFILSLSLNFQSPCLGNSSSFLFVRPFSAFLNISSQPPAPSQHFLSNFFSLLPFSSFMC